MKKFLFVLVISLSAVAQLIPTPNSQIDPTRLIVKVKNKTQAPQSEYATGIKHLFGQYYIYSTKNIQALKNDLKQSSVIESMNYNNKWGTVKWPVKSKLEHFNLNQLASSELNPFNDPLTVNLWGLPGDTQGVNLFKHLLYVKENNISQKPVLVAVVDTGVDITHPDLKGKIWINNKEIPGNNVDDDKNGYVDDVNGIDTLTRDSQGRATAHRIDGHGHGTHVSGTIAAVQNNNVGISGVSSTAIILPIRTVPANGDETDVDVAESYIYAAKMGARLINCSFGKRNQETPGLVSDAIKEIEKINQTLVIAASGNDSEDIDVDLHYPASLPNENLLVVNAIKNGGGLAYFSNYGLKNTDVGAPGKGILSLNPGNKYVSWDGTSMATPHVVGVASEILSIFPKLTAKQLKDILIKSAKPQSSLQGKSTSGGTVDLDKAREMAAQLVSSSELR